MGDYERHALQGAIAGLVTGVIIGAVVLVLADYFVGLSEVVLRRQLPPALPAEEVETVVGRVEGIVQTAVKMAPLVYAFQYLLLGALFGLVKGALRIKLGFGEVASAAAAGAIYILTLGVMPVVAMAAVAPGLLDTISMYFNPLLVAVLPGAVFTALLTAMSAIRGPWSRITEAKPKVV